MARGDRNCKQADTCDTRGLLRRCSVVSASRRYVGKETDRRWEQGEDLSLVEFKAIEYEGAKQVVASDEIKQQILKTGIRKVERETGVSHHTINRILKGENVRRKTLARIANQIQSHREIDKSQSGTDQTRPTSSLGAL